MKYRVIVADPPWEMGDNLTMSKVKRGAKSNYDVIATSVLCGYEVERLAQDDAVLALWTPSSMLTDGLRVMEAWGFTQKQTHIWVKVKSSPLKDLHARVDTIQHALRECYPKRKLTTKGILKFVHPKELVNILDFNMGRLFRQTHEVCLLGVRGKVYDHLKNRSQRSVHFAMNLKHSAKPEQLQDMLDVMFPRCKKLELFARRDRDGWKCVGLECPSTKGEDIYDSIQRLKRSGGRKHRNENVAA